MEGIGTTVFPVVTIHGSYGLCFLEKYAIDREVDTVVARDGSESVCAHAKETCSAADSCPIETHIRLQPETISPALPLS